jgi:iron(III) transport system substrate-binding protein
MMRRVSPILCILFIVIILPFLFWRPGRNSSSAQDQLVIISPHNEAIRFEFTRAFSDYYRKLSGRTVHIEWRLPGGTTEIARFLNSEFEASFRNYWVNRLKRSWNREVLDGFANPRLRGNVDEGSDGKRARYTFLHSSVGSGIDLLFGGGSFDFINMADRGLLVDSGVLRRFPGLFSGTGNLSIPRTLGGESFWDPQGRWVGVCLSDFGICYNADSLKRLEISAPPTQWIDLADERLFNEIALADPTKSGSVAKAFELIIQQQMNQRLAELAATQHSRSQADLTKQAVSEGWERGLQLLIRLSANSRYFSDSASKIPVDVAYGEAAAGMCIDFYGRFESEAVRDKNGRSRLNYVGVVGGTSVGADSVALLRGAPHPGVANAFIDFLLKPEGQKLWNFRVGTPGGPVRFALRRLPIRREFYQSPLQAWMADGNVDPYRAGAAFQYHEAWTAPLFSVIRFLVQIMCIDARDELVEARRIIGDRPVGSPPFEKLIDVSSVSYNVAMHQIRDALRSADRLKEVQLADTLTTYFRRQYRDAEKMALSK